MLLYRIFPIQAGHVVGPPAAPMLEDDSAAFSAACAAATPTHGAEAWDGTRRVVSVPPVAAANDSAMAAREIAGYAGSAKSQEVGSPASMSSADSRSSGD